MSEPDVGSTAPGFELEGTEGRVSLEALRGRWVVLAFYPGDFTPMCTKQFCSYRDDAGKLADLDAVILGISPQDLDSHQAFTVKHSLTVPLLADPGMEVARVYGVAAEGFTRRSTFIIDPDGVIQARKTHKIGLSFEDADWISDQLEAARSR